MKKRIITIISMGLVLLLAACGGEEDINSTDIQTGNAGNSEANSVSETVDLKADNWDFDQDTYVVSAGEVTINLSNEEGYHGIAVEGTDIEIEGDGSATASLEPGEYTIYCNIPCGEGHDDMVATLIVE
ncbi:MULTISPECIES: cupredoxin domain-containing protein [Evansella]|uniref:cytochrome C oxidase subunit II n=1 Tax=Evansella TaxID=2837485 RepID=UPI000997283B|nr:MULTISPECIES: cytochrome C oxidase subunit II [Evansella]